VIGRLIGAIILAALAGACAGWLAVIVAQHNGWQS